MLLTIANIWCPSRRWLVRMTGFINLLYRNLNHLISGRTNTKSIFWWFHYMLDNAIYNWFLVCISKSRTIIIIWWETIVTIFGMMLLNWTLNKILRQRLSFYYWVSRKSLLNFIDSCHRLIKFDRIIWFMNNLHGFLIQGYYRWLPQTLYRVPCLIYLRVNLFILNRWRCLWNLRQGILPFHNILLAYLLLHAPLLHYFSH